MCSKLSSILLFSFHNSFPSVPLPVQLTHTVLSRHLEQACLNLAFSLLKKKKKEKDVALRCILQCRIKTYYSISKH